MFPSLFNDTENTDYRRVVHLPFLQGGVSGSVDILVVLFVLIMILKPEILKYRATLATRPPLDRKSVV
jgi:hypothetical protein